MKGNNRLCGSYECIKTCFVYVIFENEMIELVTMKKKDEIYI